MHPPPWGRPERGSLAEREGFEPSEPLTGFNGFRDRPVQPLRHLSGVVFTGVTTDPASLLAQQRALRRPGEEARGHEPGGQPSHDVVLKDSLRDVIEAFRAHAPAKGS